jgi:hypothetical protein
MRRQWPSVISIPSSIPMVTYPSQWDFPKKFTRIRLMRKRSGVLISTMRLMTFRCRRQPSAMMTRRTSPRLWSLNLITSNLCKRHSLRMRTPNKQKKNTSSTRSGRASLKTSTNQDPSNLHFSYRNCLLKPFVPLYASDDMACIAYALNSSSYY